MTALGSEKKQSCDLKRECVAEVHKRSEMAYITFNVLFFFFYLLCRFLAFVAVLLACYADAARVETTPQSLGWSMPSLCCWVWASPASCSCQAWRGIWRRWPRNPERFLAIEVLHLFYRVAAEVFWPFLCCFFTSLQIPGFCEGGTGSSIPGVQGHVNCDVLVGYKAVYRVCFGMAMFFLLFSLIMVKVKSSQDPRAAVHNGYVGVGVT